MKGEFAIALFLSASKMAAGARDPRSRIGGSLCGPGCLATMPGTRLRIAGAIHYFESEGCMRVLHEIRAEAELMIDGARGRP
jgi:hypothetical protein